MKVVSVTNNCGFTSHYLVRDNDSEEDAESIGIPYGPPSMASLDFERMAQEISEKLAERGVRNWNDVKRSQGAVTSIVSGVVRQHVTVAIRAAS